MNRATIKKLYRQAIIEVFGPDDGDLKVAVKRDIHLGDQAPGEWAPDSVLEIYCEGGIPNGTDMFDPSWYGYEGKTVYNSDLWNRVDGIVNLMLAAMGGKRVHSEPYNNAVMNVYWS